jgi:hypothetical protein
LPHPARLAARGIGVTALLLWLVNSGAAAIVRPMIPVLQGVVEMATDDFRILDMELGADRGVPALQVRADLARPLVVSGGVLMPINSGSDAGWMEVQLALGGILQHPLMLCIVVLAWPAAGWKEYLVRACLALPLVLLLLLVTLPSTILAELWFPFHDDYAPDTFWPLLAWSRFLMGGGGLVLGLLMGAAAIGLAGRAFQSGSPASS